MNVNSRIEVLSSQIRSTHALFLGKPMSTRDSKAEDILSHVSRGEIPNNACHYSVNDNVLHPLAIYSICSYHFGPSISEGFTHWSNSSSDRMLSSTAASFNVVPSAWAFLAIFAALS